MSDKSKNIISVALFASVSVGLFYVASKYRKDIFRKICAVCQFNTVFGNQTIHVVNTVEECKEVVKKLKLDCIEYNVIGFDCEWNSVGGTRRPVALIQLTSISGFCALIRLCQLKRIPVELKNLLEDENIIKAGVVPIDDACHLAQDYGVCVASTLDLRHLAQYCNFKPEGLAKMAKSQFKIELDKNWRVSCSDWEASELTAKQKDYAAKDSHIAIELFRNMANIMAPKNSIWGNKKTALKEVLKICDVYLDVKFTVKPTFGIQQKANATLLKQMNRNMCTRSKPLYDNCYLHAPDGELLCTCDRKKALWYINKGLGVKTSDEPLIVQLNFEPAGRSIGQCGEYYKQEKLNCCVVCGKTDSYIRKNTVPREYRKLFPDIMKTHTSHDVVLLCTQCHQRSNISDLSLRHQLAEMCDAPLVTKTIGKKYLEIPNLKQVRSAARGLMMSGKHKLPEKRKSILENTILQQYPDVKELTPEFLSNLCNMNISEEVDNYASHGQQVVDYFKSQNGGLLGLERMWREHFLKTMQPKFLPNLWSVTHNANRLEIRADEGRIEMNDLLIAGLDPTKFIDFQKNQTELERELFNKTPDDDINADINSLNNEEIVQNGLLIDSNLLPLQNVERNCELSYEYDSDDTDSLLSQPSSARISDIEDISLS